ncbi:YadA domain structural protein [Synechococcus phage S-E7]|uniref:YadA domain structural protein n=1 Tax=Synechococcus phage S-P4 TaxID=2484640 RepID=A0A3G3M5Q5_9CAUD|nr:YadA domain structural protein [Synechococcus phage S-P4]AYR01840.1 YadA domain structural protein [Synechococcus phage S-P4]AYR01999.1 YadA domain structural protein [Synechococcus phage S-E7]
MTVINVLSTNAIAADATEYQVVQTGYYRVVATAGDATVSFNGGPAITLIQDQALLIKGGKPGQARIVKAVDDSTADYQLGTNLGEVTNTHPFSVGDFIAVEDASTSPAIDSNFLSAGTAGKKVTAATGNTISTDIDSSSASADYTYAYSGPQAIVKRCVKIAATGQAIVVEEIQVVGG